MNRLSSLDLTTASSSFHISALGPLAQELGRNLKHPNLRLEPLALKQVQAELKTDLILFDVALGLEQLSALVKLQFKVIALSKVYENELAQAALLAGACDYLEASEVSEKTLYKAVHKSLLRTNLAKTNSEPLAEENLYEQSKIIEKSPVMIVRWTMPDPKTVSFKYVSQNIDQFGYSSDELLSGQISWIDIMHPDDFQPTFEKYLRLVKQEDTQHIISYRIKPKSGSWRWIEDHSSLERYPDGRVKYFQGFILDITSRKKAELALEQTQTIVDSSPVILYRWLPGEKRQMKFIYISQSILQLGYTPEALLSGETNWEKICHAEDVPKIQSLLVKHLKTGSKHLSFQYRIFNSQGQMHWIEDQMIIQRNPDGSVRYFEGFIIDVTERKTFETKLSQALEETQLQAKFRSKLIQFVSYMLNPETQANFYQQLLEQAVDLIPGAQAGSLIVAEGDLFRYVATVNYDFEALRHIRFDDKSLFKTSSGNIVELINLKTQENPNPALVKEGRIQDIAITLSVAITVLGERKAYFYFDNFESQDAFGEQALEMAELLANQAASLWRRWELEEALRNEQTRLEQERNLFQTIMDAIPDAICYKDTDSRFLYVNSEFKQRFVPDKLELTGKNDFDIFPETLAQSIQQLDKQVLKSQKAVINQEQKVLDASGKTHWMLANKVPTFNKGKASGIVSVSRDISELKEKERLLQRQAAIIAQSKERISVINTHYQYVFSNQANLSYNQKTLEEITGLSVPDIIGQEIFEQRAKEQFDRCFKGEYISQEETYDNNGSPAFREISLMPFKEEGEIVGAIVSLRDITDVKQAELALHQKNVYLEALHETALGLMNRLELDELLDLLIKRANQLVNTKHGYIYLVKGQVLELVAGSGMFTDLLGLEIRRGEGASGQVWQTGESIFIKDYAHWEGRSRKVAYSHIKSTASIPLKIANKVFGVIGFVAEEVIDFESSSIELWQSFAQLAAISLDNAQLFREAQEELEERKILELNLEQERNALAEQTIFRTELAALVQQSLSGELGKAFFQNILQKAVEVIPGAQAGSLLVRDDLGNYRFETAINYDIATLQSLYLKPEEIYRDLNSNQPLRVFDIKNENVAEERRELLEGASTLKQIKVALSVPIFIDGITVALFSLDNFESQDAFSDEALEMVSIFADQVAALWQRFSLEQNLRLEQEIAQEFKDKLKALQSLSVNLSQFDNLEDLYFNIVKSARLELGFDRVAFFLDNGENLTGSFGISRQGLVRSEHHQVIDVSSMPYFSRAKQKHETIIEYDTALQDGNKTVGTGWRMMAPILTGNTLSAWLIADNLLAQQALKPYEPELLSLYADALSHILRIKRVNASLKDNEQRYRKLFIEADQSSKELLLLDKLQNAIVNKLELNELFETVVHSLAQLFNYDSIVVTFLRGERLYKGPQHGYENLLESISIHEGISGLAARTGKAQLLSNVKGSADYLEVKKDAVSSMALPFFNQEKVMGVMVIENAKTHFYQEDLEVMTKVIAQINLAIENAHLLEHVKKDLSHTQVLYRISQTLHKADNLEMLMQHITENAREALSARWVSMYKLNMAQQEIEHFVLTENSSKPLKPLSFNYFQHGLIGWTLKHAQAAMSSKDSVDVREDPEFAKRLQQSQIGSRLYVPLIYQGQIMGLLAAINHQDDPDFSQSDLDLLSTIGNQSSVALAQYHLRKQIEHQAFHDALTGLPNRVLFENRLEYALAQAERYKTTFATLFIDLDGFKHINDTLGHHMGDALLQEVSKRLKSRTRDSDTLARMGGDEFALILTNLRYKDDAIRVAQSYLEQFQSGFKIGEQNLFVGASIGVSLYPDDGEDLSSLLKHADSAMYQAKAGGKNNVRSFTHDLAEQAKRRLELETALRSALPNNELELHYQAQIDLSTGERIGTEALLRWNSAKYGFISPLQFIPIAEETGLILAIGDWVLYEACRQNVAWQNAGFKSLRVAVNISSLQFERSNFVENVVKVLEQTGLDPKYLELEVTESVVMKDVNQVINRLQELRELGISIAIDDFGTGYSSLKYLQKLPLDNLKIDRSFIKTIHSANDHAPLVNTIILLAQSFNLRTTAEGIETQEQLDYLKNLGCNEAQGYFFAKPLPAKDVWK